MAGTKEFRTKIASIKKTQKITSAMEKMSASKMSRAQRRSRASEPYARKMQNVISHLAQSHSEYQHAYMEQREVKRVGMIVVSSDRGLCGGLNTNLFRKTVAQIKKWKQQNIQVDICVIGRKAEAFFKRYSAHIVGVTTQLGDKPAVSDLIGVVKVLIDQYEQKGIDQLYVVYNEFVNTMTQKPLIEQLLPLKATTDDSHDRYWDYIYEPDAHEVIEKLLARYLESQVYQAVVENIACEQAARMIAMKSATDNAGELINKFQLMYNKARQAAITQEISEIVAGSAAV